MNPTLASNGGIPAPPFCLQMLDERIKKIDL
jgi:hypothetical protein